MLLSGKSSKQDFKMNLYIDCKRTSTCWVFDHEHQNTIDEPLCNGTENVIDHYYELFKGDKPEVGDRLCFFISTEKFPDSTSKLELLDSSDYGSNFVDNFSKMKVWLCPWLQGYFGFVPSRIYFKCELPFEGVSDEFVDDLMKDLNIKEGLFNINEIL